MLGIMFVTNAILVKRSRVLPSAPHYHMNLCTFPGSCGHSNPFSRKIYPMSMLMARNQNLSNWSRCSQFFVESADLTISCLEIEVCFLACSKCDHGPGLWVCRRHISQGKMKYLGSTRGAVTKERLVLRSQMRRKLARFPERGFGQGSGKTPFFFSTRSTRSPCCSVCRLYSSGRLPRAVIAAHAQMK